MAAKPKPRPTLRAPVPPAPRAAKPDPAAEEDFVRGPKKAPRQIGQYRLLDTRYGVRRRRTIYLPVELDEHLEQLAKERRRDVSTLFEELLQEAIKPKRVRRPAKVES